MHRHTPSLVLCLALLAPPAAPQQGGGPDAGPPPGGPPPDAAAPDDGAQDAPPDPARFMSPVEADPDAPRGVRVREAGAFEGLTLYAPLNGTTVYLVDLDGTVVHTWATDSAPGAWAYLLDDGTLLRLGREDEDPQFRGGGIGGRVQRLAPDGTVLWNHRLADRDRWQHHDAEPLPNGNLLVVAWERRSREAALDAGRDAHAVFEHGLWPDSVLELEPVGTDGAEVVWRWSAWDHLVQDRDPDLAGYGDVTAHPGRIDVNADHRDRPPLSEAERRRLEEQAAMLEALGYVGGAEEDAGEIEDDEVADRFQRTGDWLHTNAVDHHAELDLIVLSSPELCEVFVIDHSTTTEEAAGSSGGRWGRGGELLWRWGNPRTYGRGDDGDQRLFYQHDPTFVDGPDGELRLLLFNNGGGRPGGDRSSVEELVLPFDRERGFADPGEGPHGPPAPAWTYEDPGGFYSAFISGAQRLPNGNTLVCSGTAGRLFEVTRDGRVVWDYYNPHGGEVQPPEHAGQAPPLALFRGARYAHDHPGVVALLAAKAEDDAPEPPR